MRIIRIQNAAKRNEMQSKEKLEDEHMKESIIEGIVIDVVKRFLSIPLIAWKE